MVQERNSGLSGLGSPNSTSHQAPRLAVDSFGGDTSCGSRLSFPHRNTIDDTQKQHVSQSHDNEVVDEVHKKQREQGSELWVVLGHSPEAVGSRPVSLQYIGCRVSNHATAHAGASDRMIDRMIIHPWRRALLLCRFNDNVQAYCSVSNVQ